MRKIDISMSKLIHVNKEYAEWVKSLSQRFRQSQIKANKGTPFFADLINRNIF